MNIRQNFIFNNIQSGIFTIERSFHFRLIHYGHDIELSIDGAVMLTLIDYTYFGNDVGLYSASSVISLQNAPMRVLPDPEEEYAVRRKHKNCLIKYERSILILDAITIHVQVFARQ